MVYQGTVVGPLLWKVYFADVQLVVERVGFDCTVFAEDLNCYMVQDASVSNDELLDEAYSCQRELHAWGACMDFTRASLSPDEAKNNNATSDHAPWRAGASSWRTRSLPHATSSAKRSSALVIHGSLVAIPFTRASRAASGAWQRQEAARSTRDSRPGRSCERGHT